MSNNLLIFINTALIDNCILIGLLGICPLIEATEKIETSITIGLATSFIMILTSICTWIIDYWILIPLKIVYIRMAVFMLLTAIISQCIEVMIYQINRKLYYLLGIYLPLTKSNCAIISWILNNINLKHNFIQSILYSFSVAMGFLLITILFGFIREYLRSADIPKAFQGKPIILITAGLLSLSFMGFTRLTE